MRRSLTRVRFALSVLMTSQFRGQPERVPVLKGKVVSMERGEQFPAPLEGVLVRSEGSGNAVITNKSGDFELPLKGTEVPGEEIRLFFDNFAYYAVFSPYDARLVLPRYRDRVIEIHMLPIGSRRWWSDDRIEEAVSRYRSSSALDLKGESAAAETLATALRERARSKGFAEDDVQRRVKDWYEANNTGARYRQASAGRVRQPRLRPRFHSLLGTSSEMEDG